MKLLFDENLSPRLVLLLADEFPASIHVHEIGLGNANDDAVWNAALDGKYAIVTKDSDFHERSLLSIDGPRVLWIRRGNCSTEAVASLVKANADAIRKFGSDPASAVFALY